jgi:hypothetical protein
MRIGYRTITSYRVLPPKWRIIEEKDDRSPTQRYLDGVDNAMREARTHLPYAGGNDVVALIFGNQAFTHELAARHGAYLLQERRDLTERHLRDVQWRLDELLQRKPFRRPGLGGYDDASLTDVEREILNLEFQKRALEKDLWKDTQELRTNLVTERREQETTRRRISYLAGGSYGGT